MKPEPATVIRAATVASDTLAMLPGTIGPDAPLSAWLPVIEAVRGSVRTLAGLLPAESLLAIEAAGPSLDPPGAEAAESIRIHYGRATRKTTGAAIDLYAAREETSRFLKNHGNPRPEPGKNSQARRRAAAAADALSDLRRALRTAAHPAPGLASVTGHRQITEALLYTSGQLTHTCLRLRDAVSCACQELGPDGQRAARRAGGPLDHAAAALHEAHSGLAGASHELTVLRAFRRDTAAAPAPAGRK